MILPIYLESSTEFLSATDVNQYLEMGLNWAMLYRYLPTSFLFNSELELYLKDFVSRYVLF